MSHSRRILYERRYSQDAPMRTLLDMMDEPWTTYVWAAIVFQVKHLPYLLMPVFLSVLINTLASDDEGALNYLLYWSIGMAVLTAMNVPLHTYLISMISRVIRTLERTLRSALVQRLQQLSIAYHDNEETGRLQAKVLRDVEQIEIMCRQVSLQMLSAFSNILTAVVITLYTKWWMVFFYIVLVPISVALSRTFRSSIRERNMMFRSGIEDVFADVSSMLDMIPITRAHAVEQIEVEKIRKKLDVVRDRGMRLDRLNAIFGSSAWVVFQFTTMTALGVSGYLAYYNYIQVGDVVMYHQFVAMITASVSSIIAVYPEIAKGMESVRSIGEVIECPDIEENDGKGHVEAVRGELIFEEVGYEYEDSDKTALVDFNLHVRPGETIAVVGESGAGKSTLMNLIIGFRRPTSGTITLDGKNMQDLDLREYRRFLSVVPQHTILFQGSIRDNITYGLNGIDDAQFMQVLKAANAWEFIKDLPDGWDSITGEGGAKLSGGQRQRIAIARALIRDPRILILDEATSALDVVSEKLVQEAIDRLIQGRTTFIVAHRLSTIRNADRIVVMKDGRCVELGSHEELLKLGGEYARLRNLQT